MNEPSNAIIDTTQQATPQQVMTMVSSVAKATKALVGNAVINLQGKKYIKVEGWQAIAAAHGCTVTADSVKEEASGAIIATAFVRRLRDAAVLGQAEGYVGMDEVWGKRPMYARRAMAQTRAISRACRNAFAHVVVAMNSEHGTGLETTPAEEVPAEGFGDRKVASATGEVQTKKPEYNADQTAEAGRIRKECQAFKGGDDRFGALWKKMKYDTPTDFIDAASALLRDLQEENEPIVIEGVQS
jgi:hypothetical protein